MALPIVDGHLDIAMNHIGGRDQELELADLRAREARTDHQAMVTVPELRRAGVAIAFATTFVGPKEWDADDLPVYERPPWQVARAQLDVYLRWEDEGRVRIIRDRAALDAHLASWTADRVPGFVLLMESADALETPGHLDEWWRLGVRIVGPAWSRTRYSGGTKRPAGLSEIGRELVAAMRDRGVILDTSHFAWQAFWEALEIGAHRVIASHSNADAVVPMDRHLSDDMIRAIADREGVIGLNMYNHFLHPRWVLDGEHPPVGLAEVRAHAEHIAGIAGWHRLAIGSDLDGGIGLEESPAELGSVADLERLAEVVPPEHRTGFLGGNWIRLLSEALPARS